MSITKNKSPAEKRLGGCEIMPPFWIVDFEGLVNICGCKRQGQTAGAYFLTYGLYEGAQVWVFGRMLHGARQLNPLILVKVNNVQGPVLSSFLRKRSYF